MSAISNDDLRPVLEDIARQMTAAGFTGAKVVDEVLDVHKNPPDRLAGVTGTWEGKPYELTWVRGPGDEMFVRNTWNSLAKFKIKPTDHRGTYVGHTQ